MTDIIERLLDMHGGVPESYVGKLRAEAAAEIEQLRADNRALNRALDALEAKSRQD